MRSAARVERVRSGALPRGLALAAIAAVALFAALPPAAGAASRYSYANGCFTLGSGPAAVVAHGNGYRVRAGAKPTPFFMEPTMPGRYMLFDADRKLVSADGSDVVRGEHPGREAEWAVLEAPGDGIVLDSPSAGQTLGVRDGKLVLTRRFRAASGIFQPTAARGCARYPDATAGASGKPPRPLNPDGTIFGFADSHLHITANLRAGGRVIDGKPFDRFGITRALGRDAHNHGPDGSGDVTGNLLRTGLPFGTHDVHGWPTFAGWPVHDTNTHQQIYYRWLERSWMAGERVVVAQTVEDHPICKIEPLKSHSCDEMDTIALEVRRLRALQRYVDAQSGGPGDGWFRIVESPRAARRVASEGRLAVVIGVESSNLLGCSESADCTRGDVDRGLDRLQRLGISTAFIAHWVDNGFAGAALEGGVKGTFINVFEQVDTGHYFDVGPCPHPGQGEELETLEPFEMEVLSSFFPATQDLPPMPVYPAGKQCNTKGLTKLGAYLVKQMIDRGMMIELDHISERARDSVLRITSRRHYPVVSSHTGTGGAWTDGELRTLYRGGGYAAATPDQAAGLAKKLLSFKRLGDPSRFFGVGLGTDTGGFSSLPGPDPESPIDYPFRGYRSGVEFKRQRSGDRSFDLNSDGVAHYGLFADLLQGVEQQPRGEAAMRTLFRSAEAYVQTWERARGLR